MEEMCLVRKLFDRKNSNNVICSREADSMLTKAVLENDKDA